MHILTKQVPSSSQHYLTANKKYEARVSYNYPKKIIHFVDDEGSPQRTIAGEFCHHINGYWEAELGLHA